MLAVSSIIPMPQLDPAGYVALYLKNPLLLATHPERMAATAAHLAAGGYDGPALAELALTLHGKYKYASGQVPVEPRDTERMQELLELARHPRIDSREQSHLRHKIFLCRPSEYEWLRQPIEAAIQARAQAAEQAILQVA